MEEEIQISTRSESKLPNSEAEEVPPPSDLIILQTLYDEVQNARRHLSDNVKNFWNLLIFVVYFGIFLGILYHQSHTSETYQVAQAHSSLLPPSYVPGSANKFSSVDDVYRWLNNSVIQTIWDGVVCGNGVCDMPEETMAYGNNLVYGCKADCGVFQETTEVTISYATSFTSELDRAKASWNLCSTYPSHYCWYQNPQSFPGDLVTMRNLVLDLPDGNWTFQLTAPNGGVAVLGQVGNQSIFQVGFECDRSEPSNYTLCQRRCQNLTECYKEKCPLVSNSSIAFNYVKCIRSCALNDTFLLSNPLNNTKSCNEVLTETLSGSFNCGNAYISKGSVSSPLPSSTSPQNSSPGNFTGSIWEKLGTSDSDRLYRLSSAVQRILYTLIKDECLVNQPKPLSGGKSLTAFLCTFFGGPFNFTGCAFNSSTGDLLTLDSDLFAEIRRLHRSFPIFLDQQIRFADVTTWALQSVTSLDGSTVAQVNLRLRQLDWALGVDPTGFGCVIPSALIPLKVEPAVLPQYPTINRGASVQFYWADEQEHSISVFNGSGYIVSYGFGGGNSALSREAICTPENIGGAGLFTEPVSCNLVDPMAPSPHTFKYTLLMNNTGLWTMMSIRVGELNGKINVTNDSFVDNTFCDIFNLADGRCDFACNSPEYVFDGGDCSCHGDDSGKNSCPCPLGQIRDSTGVCCDSSGSGVTSTLFNLSTHSKNGDSKLTNSGILPNSTDFLTRNVASLNRVLIGMLVDQKRRESHACGFKETRFNFPKTRCLGKNSDSPFGVFPQMLTYSSLYDEAFFNQLKNETVPFPFHSVEVNNTSYGFKYLFDINLNISEALELLTYLKDGFFIDNSTSAINVGLITFNREVRMFTIFWLNITMQIGGKMAVKSDIKSLRLEQYADKSDFIRLGFECVFLINLLVDILIFSYEIYMRIYVRKQKLSSYFYLTSIALDSYSTSLMTVGVFFWIFHIVVKEKSFTIEPRYDVYEASLTSNNFFKMKNNTEAFVKAINSFRFLTHLSFTRGSYFALQGINILLLCLRLLYRMDFHPRIGLISRTFARAMPELIHFFIVWFAIFMSFSFLAHIVFGRGVEQFRNVGASMNSCFRIIIGQDSAADFLFRLDGWELAVGVIFMWSFVLIVVFVVMNLLISIVSDAYSTIRPSTPESEWLGHEMIMYATNLYYKCHPSHYSLGEQESLLREELTKGNPDDYNTKGKSLADFGRNKDKKRDLYDTLNQEDESVDVTDATMLMAMFRRRNPTNSKLTSENFVEDLTKNLKAYKVLKDPGKMSEIEEFKENQKKTIDEMREMKENLARELQVIKENLVQLLR